MAMNNLTNHTERGAEAHPMRITQATTGKR